MAPHPGNLEIEEQIYRAIRAVKPSLAVVPMSPETRFENLGLTSLDFITVVFEIEDAYGLSIVEQRLDTFRTVAEARDVVARLLAAMPGGHQHLAEEAG
jgi:acyl carrier protein